MTSLLSYSRLVQAGFDFTPSRIPLTGGGASNDSAPFKRSILWFFGAGVHAAGDQLDRPNHHRRTEPVQPRSLPDSVDCVCRNYRRDSG
jgi:hypothetical protein